MIWWPWRSRATRADGGARARATSAAAEKPTSAEKPAPPPPIWQPGELLSAASGKLHPELDFGLVQRRLSAAEFDDKRKPDNVDDPQDLFVVETFRDRLGLRTGRVLPADLFLFGSGEAPRRDATKVGGLPYWPVDRPWPKDSAGVPYRYLAQFNFADSRDLFPDLPGDVLVLLVGEEWDDWLAVEPLAIHLEWLPLGLEPVESLEPALMANPGLAFFGAIHRTADYPDAEELAEQSGLRTGSFAAIISGTKIGGFPYPIQDYDRKFNGKLLCQLGSMAVGDDISYPTASHLAESLDADPALGEIERSLNFMDAGIVYIFRNEDGTFRTSFQTY